MTYLCDEEGLYCPECGRSPMFCEEEKVNVEVDYSKNIMDRPNDCIDNNNFRRGWEACIPTLLEALRKQGADKSHFHPER